MSQMNNSQARLVDPVLTSVAQGYSNNEHVGATLFPKVPVPARGGKVVQFGKEAFMLYATGRSPGQNTKRVTFGYSGNSFALEQHALEGMLPMETSQEALSTPGIDMASVTVGNTQDIIELRLEKKRADIARDPTNYSVGNKKTLSGTSQWSDYSGVSDPSADVEAGKEAVRKKIGKRPNVAVISAAVFAALKLHPKILDRIKYTGRDVPTTELLASLWGLEEVAVGEAVWCDDNGVFSDIWGKDVVLAFVQTGTLQERGKPSYGYTYQLNGFPEVEESYYDRSAKSWIFPVTDEVAPVIAGADAGYLITSAVA